MRACELIEEEKMHACGGSMMGAVQQSVWMKGSGLHPKISTGVDFPWGIRLNSLKPCKASHVEGRLVTGRPPSSVSVPAPGIDGNPISVGL